MFSTKITIDTEDTKKSFDEIALSRCCVMATQSLNPEEFELFSNVHNILIARRRLQNEKIPVED